ncbi:MAG: CotH kinase family protein [Cryomorphaceae bacterium]|jgi:hypothetical protein|nr:CotH kinase family protein [Cryomorphaceae bacterium]
MKKLLALILLTFCILAGNLKSQTTFYDRATIQKIEIFFASASWDALLDAATTTDSYIIADSVRINGVVFDSVGVKYKGNSSYNASNNKNPLHLNLDYIKGSQDYEGYTEVKLQNGYQDPSMIREVLSYAILEQYMDCPKANFANVYINGSLRGLYSNAESITEDFCGDHFYTSEDTFFKCNPIGGAGPGGGGSPDLTYLGADSSLYQLNYELKSTYGWDDLVEMIDILNNNFTQIETVLDVDRALWMLAFNNVLVNLDSYSGAFRQNYYLYKDLNGRFDPILWDLNMSFGGFPGGTGSGPLTSPSTLDPLSNSTSPIHPLIVKMLSDPMFKRMYMAHLRTIVQEIFASGNYLTTANALRATINTSVQLDPYKFFTYTQFQNSLTTATPGGGPMGSTIPGIQQLMDARSTYFASNAEYLLVAPSINSFSPSNPTPVYGETITMNFTCSNETAAYFGYRYTIQDKFTRVPMYDDGLHNDGVAGDHVYGVNVTLNCSNLQYYFYTENNDAGLFSPQRAEHEYHTLAIAIPAPLPGEIVINEIMADNGSIVEDNYGEKDDWIELFNTTSSAKDLSLMFLSDDPLLLNEWQFPAGSYIAPNAYLIVWADKDADQSGLHTNFKLSSLGETLFLGNGTTAYEQIAFPIQTTDISYARCPDAAVFDFAPPTFAATNNCYAGVKEEKFFDVRVYPVPFSGELRINAPEVLAVQVSDLTGRIILNTTIPAGESLLNTTSWNAGVYTVTMIDSVGLTGNRKVVKY